MTVIIGSVRALQFILLKITVSYHYLDRILIVIIGSVRALQFILLKITVSYHYLDRILIVIIGSVRATINNLHFKLVKITVSYHYLRHEGSAGKLQQWVQQLFFHELCSHLFSSSLKSKHTTLFCSYTYISFDPEEWIASNFSLEYHNDKGNDHYLKKIKVLTQIHLSAP